MNSSSNTVAKTGCGGACAEGCAICDTVTVSEWHAPVADDDSAAEDDPWAHGVPGVSHIAPELAGQVDATATSTGTDGSSFSDGVVDPNTSLDDGSLALIGGDPSFGKDVHELRTAGLARFLPARVSNFQHSAASDPITRSIIEEFERPQLPSGAFFLPSLTSFQLAIARVQLRSTLGVIAYVHMMSALGHEVYMVRVNGVVKIVMILA
jgi:hypothetical protein